MGCLESLHTLMVFLLLGGRVLKWEEKQRPSSQQKDPHVRVKREQNPERKKIQLTILRYSLFTLIPTFNDML